MDKIDNDKTMLLPLMLSYKDRLLINMYESLLMTINHSLKDFSCSYVEEFRKKVVNCENELAELKHYVKIRKGYEKWKI